MRESRIKKGIQVKTESPICLFLNDKIVRISIKIIGNSMENTEKISKVTGFVKEKIIVYKLNLCYNENHGRIPEILQSMKENAYRKRVS